MVKKSKNAAICHDEQTVNEITPKMSDVDGVEEIFKALADPTRLKIAYALTLAEELCVHDVASVIGASDALTLAEELCVHDVASVIGASDATASHHLRLLRTMKLAKQR